MNRGTPRSGPGGPTDPSMRPAATFAEKQPPGAPGPAGPGTPADAAELYQRQWKTVATAATVVAALTAPFFFLLFHRVAGWSTTAAIIVAVLAVFAFRGLLDVLTRRLLPVPGVFDADRTTKEADLAARRRAWFWRFWYGLAFAVAIVWLVASVVVYLVDAARGDASLVDAIRAPWDFVTDRVDASGAGSAVGLALTVAALFLVNVLIFLGPLVVAGARQIKYFEPGDANWGVALDDVRGQSKAKDEVQKIVSLWQSGSSFEQAGGKRERGVLFYGAPGTGKTMLARAMATGFNCPFVVIPGPGIQQSFIGVDVILLNYVMWRARRLAQKWGGQCIVFIDEIDAIGSRRSVLSEASQTARSVHDVAFFGPMGALNASGDLIKESEAWRERLFRTREPSARPLYPAPIQRAADRAREFAIPGLGSGMGGSALQQLLIAMDGFAIPRLSRRFVVNRVNTLLDATYVIPSRIGRIPLRLAPARPPKDRELFFVGACNTELEALDPALTRPGRMGRHVIFRTPNRSSRADIIDLYLGKVAHDPDLDRLERRDELARITMGHSPAMIEQVCSLALTYAHNDRRTACEWRDLTEAITVVEYGLESGFEFVPSEERAIAIHEAGHAVTGHAYLHESHRSSRLTITPRGDSAGHHMMHSIDERFAWWQHEKFGDLVWTLGAMAAEHVFYGENGEGVGGDIGAATREAAWMVGTWGMAPKRPELRDRFATLDESDVAEQRVMDRYERLGTRILNRSTQGSTLVGDPVATVLSDQAKLAMVAQLLGQAFMAAYWFVQHNKGATQRVAELLIERRALFGDEVVDFLDGLNLTIPTIDVLDEAAWPRI